MVYAGIVLRPDGYGHPLAFPTPYLDAISMARYDSQSILESVMPSLETIDWYSFLSRPKLPSVEPEALESLGREPILITGAGGSIGSELVIRLAPTAQRLVILESSESNLFSLQRDLTERASAANVTFILGSISDCALLDEIFSIHVPRTVFHAAAFKHVPLMEEQPLAAIANNIFGTNKLVSAASSHRARVVLLSTDKAVEPASIMGATKRVAEQIVLAASGIVLRLGNVLASRDSVTEIFAHQIAAGESVTVTDPAARRYFLTLAESADLLFSAAASEAPALFVPDLLAPQFIADLARFMARTLASDRSIPIEFTSPRVGDKESEKLWSSSEALRQLPQNGLISIESPALPKDQRHHGLESLGAAVDARDISTSITILRTLVPDFTPSRTLLERCGTVWKAVHE
jgi:FlaA1/EpsC-like NDP-sugar epimerase